MDIASLAGVILCFAMLIYGIISSAGMAGFGQYLDVPSFIITLGGSVFATLASVSLSDFIGGLKSFLLIFKSPLYLN